MPRNLQAFLVLSVCAMARTAVGQEGTEEASPEAAAAPEAPLDEAVPEAPVPEEPSPEPPPEPAPTAEEATGVEASAGVSFGGASADVDSSNNREADDGEEDAAEPAPEGEQSGWNTSVSGYFRAPFAIGISNRPGPDDPDGPPVQQFSYAPTRTVDANYYSFAYTRLQETDWAEVFIRAKREHVEAVVGWMGYWYQAAGFRNYDAAWAPGMAYLTLDTDFELAGLKPHVAFTGGAWWPKFGAFDKYDTFTLGRFRHVGEQLRFTIPVSEDFTATIVQGFGTSRDGNFSVTSPPPYQATVGLDLLHYEHVQLRFGEHVDLGLHYNSQWTRDPNLFETTEPGKAFTDAREASLTTIGAELTLKAPYAGSLWVSPSMIEIKNGWALAQAGVEVMHSIGAEGLATNYLGWSGSLRDSNGSGSMRNLGFLYENTLSGIQGKEPYSDLPEVKLNVFGLFADTTLDLPEGSLITHDRIGQFKYGADVEVQPLDWLSVMLRWDEVNYDLGSPGYVFSAITPRLTFSSHFLSGESIYIQYSRYRYGDRMVLAGQWPWGTQLVAGSNTVQGGPYAGDKPDMDVVKLQASIAF